MPNKRKRLYWSLQFAGWGAYFGIWASVRFLADHNLTGLLCWVFIAAGYLVTSHAMHYVIRRRAWVDLPPAQLTFRLLLLVLAAAFAANLLVSPFPPLLGLNSFAVQFQLFAYFVPAGFLLFAVWSVIYLAFQYFWRYRDSEMRRLRLEVSTQEAELRALKAQINPHFLFNCLNNLRALIPEDPTKAREMLLRLSELLRYSLEASRRDKVSLDQELHVVESYLALEKLQFENRLTWRFAVPNETRQTLIPPMLLQQLVENAVKHGIASTLAGGEIGITAVNVKQNLQLEVVNTGRLQDSPHKGFGIENVRNRLRLLCGPSASFELRESGEGHVSATARIPFAA